MEIQDIACAKMGVILGLKLVKSTNISLDNANIDSSDVLEKHGNMYCVSYVSLGMIARERFVETATLRQCTLQRH